MFNKIKNYLRISILILMSTHHGVNSFAQQSIPAFDNEFECTPKNKADQYIRDFSIDIQSFGGIELCKSEIDSKKLFTDFNIVENGQFENPRMHTNDFTTFGLNRNFIPQQNYYIWLKSQTEGVKRGNDVPYATAYNSMGYFTMQNGWALLSTLGRVGVIIHEARHTEGYRHIPCKQGPYQGSSLPGCDSTYDYAGSHAIEMEYYSRVVTLGKNFHPLYKKMARLMAMGRANFVFNQPVITKREALFVTLENSNEAFLIDGSQTYRRELSGAGILKRTSAGVSLFDGFKAWSLDPYEIIGDLRQTEDGYSYYKLLAIKKGLPQDFKILDFEEFDDGTKRYVTALDEKNRLANYEFQNGTWGATQDKSDFKPVAFKTQLANKEKGLFLINNRSEILKYSFKKMDFETVAGGDSNWSPQIKTYAEEPSSKDLLQLTQDGQIQFVKNGASYPLVEGLGKISGIVNIPLYDEFKVR